MIDPRRYGHYQVGDLVVYSKVEAIELSIRLGSTPTWHYNDEVFSSMDWSKEPDRNLSDFYKDRARQIRDAYDHVVLFYSGGADSHNMLESFLHAGVRIDEIASFHSLDADRDRDSEFNKEIFQTAIPVVESFKRQGRLSSETQHRLIDMGEIIDRFCQDIDWLDFPYMIGSAVSINNVARSHLRKYIRDWADIIDQGKRLVLVWGHDKPRIMSEGSRFFLNFMDIFDNCVSTKIQQSVPAGWYDEIFYSTPDLPEMVVKQAHVIKRFLENCDDKHPWVTDSITGLGHAVKRLPDGSHKTICLTQDGQSMLIYPWFRPELYYESKPNDVIFSKRDRWFWSDRGISSRYHATIDGMISRFGADWFRQDQAKGIRCTRNFRSRKYWLN